MVLIDTEHGNCFDLECPYSVTDVLNAHSVCVCVCVCVCVLWQTPKIQEVYSDAGKELKSLLGEMRQLIHGQREINQQSDGTSQTRSSAVKRRPSRSVMKVPTLGFLLHHSADGIVICSYFGGYAVSSDFSSPSPTSPSVLL